MDPENKQNQDPENGQNQDPKTYTQEEVDALVLAAKEEVKKESDLKLTELNQQIIDLNNSIFLDLLKSNNLSLDETQMDYLNTIISAKQITSNEEKLQIALNLFGVRQISSKLEEELNKNRNISINKIPIN